MESLAEEIYRELGPGHSESVYHNAFEVLLREKGYQYETERILPIVFKGCTIGNFRCDIIVNNTIIELKSTPKLKPEHHQQIKNYMRILPGHEGILINFGSISGLEYKMYKI
jgi:GxxExxY protein